MYFEKVSKEQYLRDALEDKMIIGSDTVRLHCLTPTDLESVYEGIELPKRATKYSAGYDFYAPYEFTLRPGETIKIATGIRVKLDDDKFLMSAPRSSHGFKARIQLDNTVGIIDADYYNSSNEGHIHYKLTNDSHTGTEIHVKKGEGIVQAIILQYFKVDDDNTTSQRDGGFGSTND